MMLHAALAGARSVGKRSGRDKRAVSRRPLCAPAADVKKSIAARLYAFMSDYIDNQGFRANVGIVLLREGGDVFLGGRRDGRGWQFPQGGVQRNERPLDALYRELHEEVGLQPADVELVAGTNRWLRYRLPRQYVRRRNGPLCIGQKQRWYLLRMLADESRLNFDATPSPEFDSGRWVDYWSPVREVIYFKRSVYARALQELGDQAFPDGPPPRPEWWNDDLLTAGPPGRRDGSGKRRAAVASRRAEPAESAETPLALAEGLET
jgi:putative (di)nucleoside polyphosphate hydrolase